MNTKTGKKLLNRILSVIMCAALLTGNINITAYADVPEDENISSGNLSADEEVTDGISEGADTVGDAALNLSTDETDGAFLIGSTADWESFSEYVLSGGETSGVLFRMTGDIAASVPVGTDLNRFKGIFDGNGHTLTVDYTDDDNVNAMSPFRYVDGAEVKNLCVEGTIRTGKQFASGLIGIAYNTVSITSCRVGVSIISETSGDGTHGGFVAIAKNNARVSVDGCIFDGKLLGENTNKCGGFFGWREGQAYITDSLFIPQELTIQEDDSAVFFRRELGNCLENCLYKTAFGMVNDGAVKAVSVTAGEGTIIDFGEPVKSYGASGLGIFESGMMADGVFYAESGAEISLTLSTDESSNGFSTSQGTLTQTDNGYILTVENEDVVINAARSYEITTAVTGNITLDLPENALAGERVTGRCTSEDSYWVTITVNGGDIALTYNDDGSFTFVMPDGPAHVEAVFRTFDEMTVDGETWSVIGSAEDWRKLSGYVAAGKPTEGKKYRLTADIETDLMVGNSEHAFKGTFDGADHTITVTYHPENTMYIGVFSFAENAVFQNICVKGTISARGSTCVGSLAGCFKGTNSVVNCVSSVNLQSTYSGKANNGGFFGCVEEGAELTVEGCRFDGIIDAPKSYGNGGFLGKMSGSLVLKDCLFVPEKITWDKVTCGMFVSLSSGTASVSNCYYRGDVEAGNGINGAEAYTITSDESVEVEYLGSALEYGLSGITAYERGIYYEDTFLAGAGSSIEMIIFYIGPESSDGFVSSSGELTGEEGKYTLVMADSDAVIMSGNNYSIMLECEEHGNAVLQESALNGEKVTFQVTPDKAYWVQEISVDDGNVSLTDNGDGTYSFIMPDKDITVKVGFDTFGELVLEGSNTYYKIQNAEDWQRLAEFVESGKNFPDIGFRLEADIATSVMVGSESHKFSNVFDGNGHTITVDFDDGGNGSPAPFRYAADAEIKNLHVDGIIRTSGQFAAGLVGNVSGKVTIINCRVSAEIQSSKEGDGTHGGIVGVCQDNTVLRITGCLFDGKIEGEETSDCGGFVGWRRGDLLIKDSLCAPASVTVSSTGCAIFFRNPAGDYLDNCMYTLPFGYENSGAVKACRITSGADVMINYGETEGVYDVSGITLYAGGFLVDDVFYAGSGSEISIQLFYTGLGMNSGFTATSGELSLSGENYVFTAGEEDAVINPKFSFTISVSEGITGGSVTVDAAEASPGDVVPITVTPKSGYMLDMLQADSKDVVQENGSYSFVMPSGNVLIKAAFVPGGSCGMEGSNLFWKYHDGTLTIFGSGKMRDYNDEDEYAPWYEYGPYIEEVVIEEGAAGIGSFAFADCSSLTEITIPAGIESIGLEAFRGCTSVENVYFMGTDYSGYGFEEANRARNFNTPEGTILHISVDPASLSESTGNAVFYWYNADNQSVVCGELHTVTIRESENGSVTANAASGYAGQEVLVTVLPSEGYELEALSVTDEAEQSINAAGKGNSVYSFVMPESDTQVGASFRKAIYSIGTSPDMRNGTVNPNVSEASAGDIVSFSAVPNEGYALKSLSVLDADGNEVAFAEETDGSYTFMMPCSSVVLTAAFCETYDIVIDENITNGSVTAGAYTAAAGEAVTLTVEEESGYKNTEVSVVDADGNSVSVSGTANEEVWMFTMPESSVTVRASFKKKYAVRVADDIANGSITADVDAAVAGETVTISVTPADEYYYSLSFLRANDEELSAENGTASFVMPEEDVVITGAFYMGGSCGENLFWELQGEHLIITGTGDMTSRPWAGSTYSRNLESVEFPEGMTSIDRYAFSRCELLENVVIPDSVTTIGQGAFEYCGNLKSIKLSENLKRLETYLFYSCSSLEHLDIPDSVTEIGERVFTLCTSLKSVKMSANLEKIETNAFEHAPLSEIDFRGASAAISERAFFSCGSLVRVKGAENLTEIGVQAFGDCGSLESFSISDNVREISSGAFIACRKLESITFGSGLTIIGAEAFSGCDSLITVDIPEGVTTLNEAAFYDCPYLETVHLPESLETIGERAFCADIALREINIPRNVKSIGRRAFSSCSALKSLEIPSGVKTLAGNDFEDCTAMENVYFYGTDFSGYSFSETEFNTCDNTVLHILYFIDPASLTSEDGSIYIWYKANPNSVINDIDAEGYYRVNDRNGYGGALEVESYVKAGETVPFTVTPEEGYDLVSVQVVRADGSQLEIVEEDETNFTFVMPEESVEIRTQYRLKDGYYEIMSAILDGGWVMADRNAAKEGDTVVLTAKPEDGYRVIEVETDNDTVVVTENADGTWSFEMPDGDVEVLGVFEQIWDLEETDDGRIFLLKSSGDWDKIAAYSETGRDMYNMKFRMENDITISTMIGQFNGVFDGNGHTLTLNYQGDDHELAAPFLSTDVVVIKNLHIDGIISSTAAGITMCGLIGNANGKTTITNVRSSVTIEAGNENVSYHSGFIGKAENSSNVTMTGCVFDGKALGSDNNSIGGFIGWAWGTRVIKDSFFAPTEFTFGIDKGAAFAVNQASLANSYALFLLNKLYHAEVIHSLRVEEDIEADIDLGSISADYDVSGMTCYEKGFIFDGVTYVKTGSTVGLDLTCKSGTTTAIFQASGGTFAKEGSIYSLYMPDQDVVISALYPITLDEAQNGSIVCSKTEAAPGEEVTVTAAPDEGYETVSLTCNGEKLDVENDTCTFIMPADEARITAAFAVLEKCGDSLYGYVLDETLHIFGSGAMYDYSAEEPAPWADSTFTKIEVESGAASIGNYAFNKQSAVREVSLPDTLLSIGARAFGDCGKLESIDIPGSVETIGESAFFLCTSLAKITLSEGIRGIGSNAFKRCTALKAVTIPASMQTIGLDAFYMCGNVTDVYIRGTEYSGFAFDTRVDIDHINLNDFSNRVKTVLHLPKSVDPGSLTEENGNAVYFWYLNESDRVVSDLTDAAVPSFKSGSLVLSGKIGVHFFMDLPVAEGLNYTDSYVEFTVEGKNGFTDRDLYDADEKNSTGEYYGFICYLNSIQMAEPVRAIFHYTVDGEEKTVETTYSVKQYMLNFEQHLDLYDENTIALVKSLADYGHYIQLYLSEERGWTIGEDYAEMDKFYKTSYDMNTIRTAVSAFAISSEKEGSDTDQVTFNLLLDTDTSLRLYIKPAEGYTGNMTFTVDGAAADAVVDSRGRYRVEIPKIPAHELGTAHTITAVTDNGSETINISALSYADVIFKGNASENARNAMAALYSYFKAADDYKMTA